jgi:hypothetical protein
MTQLKAAKVMLYSITDRFDTRRLDTHTGATLRSILRISTSQGFTDNS